MLWLEAQTGFGGGVAPHWLCDLGEVMVPFSIKGGLMGYIEALVNRTQREHSGQLQRSSCNSGGSLGSVHMREIPHKTRKLAILCKRDGKHKRSQTELSS